MRIGDTLQPAAQPLTAGGGSGPDGRSPPAAAHSLVALDRVRVRADTGWSQPPAGHALGTPAPLVGPVPMNPEQWALERARELEVWNEFRTRDTPPSTLGKLGHMWVNTADAVTTGRVWLRERAQLPVPYDPEREARLAAEMDRLWGDVDRVGQDAVALKADAVAAFEEAKEAYFRYEQRRWDHVARPLPRDVLGRVWYLRDNVEDARRNLTEAALSYVIDVRPNGRPAEQDRQAAMARFWADVERARQGLGLGSPLLPGAPEAAVPPTTPAEESSWQGEPPRIDHGPVQVAVGPEAPVLVEPSPEGEGPWAGPPPVIDEGASVEVSWAPSDTASDLGAGIDGFAGF